MFKGTGEVEQEVEQVAQLVPHLRHLLVGNMVMVEPTIKVPMVDVNGISCALPLLNGNLAPIIT
jgi:hypothetical protein